MKKKKKEKENQWAQRPVICMSLSRPNGNTFTDGELQVEIFFLIIGHPYPNMIYINERKYIKGILSPGIRNNWIMALATERWPEKIERR